MAAEELAALYACGGAVVAVVRHAPARPLQMSRRMRELPFARTIRHAPVRSRRIGPCVRRARPRAPACVLQALMVACVLHERRRLAEQCLAQAQVLGPSNILYHKIIPRTQLRIYEHTAPLLL